jgi:hypothetical protein
MRTVGFDFETALIRPGLQCPPPVCASVAPEDGPSELLTSEDWPAFAGRVRALIADPNIRLVVHNGAAYDFPVALAWLDCTAEIFDALEQGHLIDTMWVERLAIIRRISRCGPYGLSLVDLCRAHGVLPPTKDETQTSYEPLRGRPRSEYSDRQVEYAIEDSVAHLNVWQDQQRWFDEGRLHWSDVATATRKHFALALTRAWGMRTDPERTDALETAIYDMLEDLQDGAKALEADVCDPIWDRLLAPEDAKLLAYVERERALARRVGATHRPMPVLRTEGPKAGSKDAYALQLLVLQAYDGKAPRTRPPRRKPGEPERAKAFVPSVSTARATLEDSSDVGLTGFAEYGEWSAVANKDLAILLSGVTTPIHTSFGMADTTRSTSFAPNVQNQRRDKPRRPSVRECFVARPGHVLIASDHCGLELSTLAQCCVTLLGRMHMAGLINGGIDLHSVVGAAILRQTYDAFRKDLKSPDELVSSAAKNARNNGKVVNFGKPGGMGWPTLKLYAKQNYGISLDDQQAQHLCQMWGETLPDGPAFLEYVHTLENEDGLFDVTIPGTKIVRRNCTYCAACNTHFQGLGAVLEGHIAWLFAREIHLGVTPEGRPSPMRWAHPWNFVHDEHIFEVLEEARTEVNARMLDIMREGARKYLPDVKCESESTCMRRWSKRAKSTIGPDGELTIWDC